MQVLGLCAKYLSWSLAGVLESSPMGVSPKEKCGGVLGGSVCAIYLIIRCSTLVCFLMMSQLVLGGESAVYLEGCLQLGVWE
jgi:hypothetical protein